MPLAREQRKLAAIVAADVVGYSRLMGRDESGTLARLRKNRSEHLDPVLRKYGGRLVKLTGDGALIEFGSAVDALSAAIEFQHAMAEANADLPADSALVFRMGLHLGDLIVDGDDLYGDGVNIAARLEAEAPAGGIVISRNVQDAVAGRLKATFDDLGSLALKNIERPVQAFGVTWRPEDWQPSVSPDDAAVATAASQSSPTPLPLPDKPSIAVLPFQNMSGDPEQEYFADGISEDIITELSRFKSLFVVARNSSFTYKHRAVDIKQIGRALGVRYVLEGSVRKAGARIRITGQLVESGTGTHLWADRFDGALEDVFSLQEQVATKLVAAVAPRLDQAELARVRRKPIDKFDAYDWYLRGLSCMNEETAESYAAALPMFRQAMEIDPAFATPFGLAARCYIYLHQENMIAQDERERTEVRRLASKVQLIGRDDPVALCGAGHAFAFVCRELETGAKMIDLAVQLNPNLAAAWQSRGIVSLYLGEYQQAIDQLTRVLRMNPLDPLSFRSEGFIGWGYMLQGRYEEAIKWADAALAHHPAARSAMRVAAAANALTGNIAAARKVVKRMLEINPQMSISLFRAIAVFPRAAVEPVVQGLRLAGLPE
jgi:adenylate cyclase